MINVLFVAFATDHFDGSIYSLMDLIKSVENYVNPIVLLPAKGIVYDFFTNQGVECIVSSYVGDLCTNPITVKQWIGYIVRYVPNLIRLSHSIIRCSSDVAKILKERNIQIVHINSTVLSVGYFIAKKLNCKLVWHLRGFLDLDFGWKPISGWKGFKYMLLKSDAIIAITNSVLNHFVEPGTLSAFSIFDAVRSRRDIIMVEKKKPYFLFCAGLLTKQKGCDFAIKAFARSGLSRHGYRLRIIGRCSDVNMKLFIELATKLGVNGSIDFLPFTENVKIEMSNASALLMCSENEGLGRVSVEAMFYGCLVIGRNSGGTKDFVFHKNTGLLFNNIDECAYLMNWIIQHDCSSIIKKAQQYVLDNFSIENYGEKILSVYYSVLKQL